MTQDDIESAGAIAAFVACAGLMIYGLVGGLSLVSAWAASDAPVSGVHTAEWKPIEPPHAGLRCWYTYSVGHGAAYCEQEKP